MNIKKIGTKANDQQPVMSLFGEPNRVQHNSMQINNYKIRINGDIIEPSAYNEEIGIIEDLNENDSCTLLFNSGGGYLDTCVDFLAAIDSTEGHVHAHITGKCHSAASMMFLRCHSWSISRYATMLIHAPSGGTVGKFSDNFKEIKHFEKWVDTFYRDIYEDFLTSEEITNVLNGTDLWLNSEQLEERLIKLSEIRTEKMEQAMLEEGSEDVPLPDSDGWFENTGNVTDDEYEVPVNLSPNDRVQVVFRDGTVDCDKAMAYNWTLVDEYSEIVKYRLAGDSE